MNNPLAFPTPSTSFAGVHLPPNSGMSLRDYFAAQALPAIINDDPATLDEAARAIGIPSAGYRWQEHWPIYCAWLAYAMADAMLAEREKGAEA